MAAKGEQSFYDKPDKPEEFKSQPTGFPGHFRLI